MKKIAITTLVMRAYKLNQYNVYDTTLAMYEILMAGGFSTGGLNFDFKIGRPSYESEDIFHAFILGMDAFALGLIKTAKLIKDGRIDQFVSERYASLKVGIGKKIVNDEVTLESLSKYAEKWTNLRCPVPADKNIYKIS